MPDIIERNAKCASQLFEAGAEIDRLRAERNMWHARAFAMFWKLPANITCGELQSDAQKAMAFLGYEQRTGKEEQAERFSTRGFVGSKE